MQQSVTENEIEIWGRPPYAREPVTRRLLAINPGTPQYLQMLLAVSESRRRADDKLQDVEPHDLVDVHRAPGAGEQQQHRPEVAAEGTVFSAVAKL
jgi:hypothetical protein